MGGDRGGTRAGVKGRIDGAGPFFVDCAVLRSHFRWDECRAIAGTAGAAGSEGAVRVFRALPHPAMRAIAAITVIIRNILILSAAVKIISVLQFSTQRFPGRILQPLLHHTGTGNPAGE